MKYMSGFLCLALVAGLSPAASADLVIFEIDDFSVVGVGTPLGFSQDIDPGAGVLTRTLFSGASTSGADLLAVVPSTSTNPPGSPISVRYDFTGIGGVNATSPLPVSTLLFRSPSVFATPTRVNLTFRDSLGTALDSIQSPGTIATGSEFHVDISSFAGLANVEVLDIEFLDGAGAITFESLAFSSVPEPASLALMGMAVVSAGGVGALRRRRNQISTDAEPDVVA